MTRLEELFLKWRDREIGEDELRELNDLLRDSEARRQLFDTFRFDMEVANALRAVDALARSAARCRNTRHSNCGSRSLLRSRHRNAAWR